MNSKTDKQLIDAIRQKFEEKDKALFDLHRLNKTLEETNNKLLESERLKTTFLSNLKNELNNPMASILGLCEELRTSYPGKTEKIKDIADSLFYEALSLEFQLNNILMAAEFESGEFMIEMMKMEANSIINSVIKNFTPMISDKKISIIKQYNNPVWINSDPDKFRIIISNLISNAILFNKDGGRIIIDVELVQDVFFLSVKDDGIGIPADKLNVIFDRFVQLDAGSTKRFRGHGLGLSVAKAAANFLNGTISVASNPFFGSRFTLMLPANSEIKSEGLYDNGVEFFEVSGEEKEL